MSEERDYDYVVGKLPRKDKQGKDATGDRIGKGGRHRDNGTYSAVAYDLEVVDKDPMDITPPEPKVVIQREIVEVERKPQRVEDLPLGQQLVYRLVDAAIPYVVDGAFELAGRGFNAAVDYGKRKWTERKEAKEVVPEKKYKLKVDEVINNNLVVQEQAETTTVLDKVDIAYENYTINMTSEEAQKELVDAFILRLLSEKKLWKIAHANIVNADGTIENGQTVIDKLSSPFMLDKINMILSNNQGLLETWQTLALEDILGRELIVNSQFVPIDGQTLKKNLMSLSA